MGDEMPKPWKYTDDMIAWIVVVAYIVQNWAGIAVPDWAMATALVYALGIDIVKGLERPVSG